jgi:peroxiredoxin
MLQAGATAPSVCLRDRDGHEHSLDALTADGPALLAFFKISCPVCQMTMPYLERLRENGKIRIIGVSQDDVRSTAEFLEEFSPGVETLYDPRPYAVSNAFRITHVPTLFQVEPGGSISYAWSGFSKQDLTRLGERAGQAVFREGERVPEFRPG